MDNSYDISLLCFLRLSIAFYHVAGKLTQLKIRKFDASRVFAEMKLWIMTLKWDKKYRILRCKNSRIIDICDGNISVGFLTTFR